MSDDTNAEEKSGDEKKEVFKLEKIIRDPKSTQTEEMRNCVNMIYARHHGSYTLLLKNICPLRNRTIRIDAARKEITIVDMGTCNKFLDCFAPSIKKLKIEYSVSEDELKHRAQFDRILNKYCAEHIVELKITRAPKEAMMQMKKPFSNVEAVEFEDCIIAGKLADFNYCFPKMKKLIIWERIFGTKNRKKFDGKCIAKHFPNLEYMRIDVSGPGLKQEHFVERSIEMKHAAAALQLNPQLRTLTTGSGCTTKFFEGVSRYLQRVENLKMERLFDDLDSGTVHLKNVKKLIINCFEMKKIPLKFDQLEELSLNSSDFVFKRNDIIEFILKHPTITKLHVSTLLNLFVMSDETKVKIAKGLPSLADVFLDFPCSDVIFLTECKSLKKIRFKVENLKEYETLRRHIGTEWEATIEEKMDFFADQYVTLEKSVD